MNSTKSFLIFLVTLILFGLSCDLPHEPGPMPKQIVKSEFQPGMNILGVLRADDSTGTSFVYIEKAFKYSEYDKYAEKLPIVEDAEVVIQAEGDTTQYRFIYGGEVNGYKYLNPHFAPVPGKKYNLIITHPELPTIMGITTVPERPNPRRLNLGTQILELEIEPSSYAEMYEIYLLFENQQLCQSVPYNMNQSLVLNFPIKPEYGTLKELHIYAYDQNLAFLFKAGSTVIPQTYLQLISKVDGGYGCFGAVSVYKRIF